MSRLVMPVESGSRPATTDEAGTLSQGRCSVDDEDCTFYYRGYLLICVPTQMGSGWSARAAVVRYDGPNDVVIADSPPGIPMISEEVAVAYARAWGQEWVDANA